MLKPCSRQAATGKTDSLADDIHILPQKAQKPGRTMSKCAALENMQLKEASDVLLWKTRHFVQTAKYTVIHRK